MTLQKFFRIFLKPNKTQPKCDICDGYQKASDAAKVHLQMEYDYHIKNTEICRNRRRWKKSRLARAERKRIAKKQMLLQKQQADNQPQK